MPRRGCCGAARTARPTALPRRHLRTCATHVRGTVTRFFDGLELVEPGVVQLARWRPRTEAESQAAAALWGGVAVKRPY